MCFARYVFFSRWLWMSLSLAALQIVSGKGPQLYFFSRILHCTLLCLTAFLSLSFYLSLAPLVTLLFSSSHPCYKHPDVTSNINLFALAAFHVHLFRLGPCLISINDLSSAHSVAHTYTHIRSHASSSLLNYNPNWQHVWYVLGFLCNISAPAQFRCAPRPPRKPA